MEKTGNQKSFRKIELYTTLPSGGAYWPDGSIDLSSSNPSKEIGIMPMTMLDEINLRTPDSLMNGEAVVSMIKSCCPQIKDPWNAPLLDLETILVGIRIATYGPQLNVSVNVPEVNVPHEFTIDISDAIANLVPGTFMTTHTLSNGHTINIKPMTYRTMTETNIKNYEQARLATNLRNTDLTEAQRMEEIQKSFKNITNLTIKNMADQVTSVETPDGSVSTTSQVFQYVTNIPAPIAQEIKTIVTEQNALGTMKPVTIQVPEDLVKQGAPKTITQSLMLDQANFFVLK
jgi:hypothetical protein